MVTVPVGVPAPGATGLTVANTAVLVTLIDVVVSAFPTTMFSDAVEVASLLEPR